MVCRQAVVLKQHLTALMLRLMLANKWLRQDFNPYDSPPVYYLILVYRKRLNEFKNFIQQNIYLVYNKTSVFIFIKYL